MKKTLAGFVVGVVCGVWWVHLLGIIALPFEGILDERRKP